jgi:hypothetical protein
VAGSYKTPGTPGPSGTNVVLKVWPINGEARQKLSGKISANIKRVFFFMVHFSVFKYL